MVPAAAPHDDDAVRRLRAQNLLSHLSSDYDCSALTSDTHLISATSCPLPPALCRLLLLHVGVGGTRVSVGDPPLHSRLVQQLFHANNQSVRDEIEKVFSFIPLTLFPSFDRFTRAVLIVPPAL